MLAPMAERRGAAEFAERRGGTLPQLPHGLNFAELVLYKLPSKGPLHDAS